MILGVRGERHPLRQYLRAGVPVVIATDDEGVARSDLTNDNSGPSRSKASATANSRRYRGIRNQYSLPAEEKARVRHELEAAFERFESGIVQSPR